MFWNGSLLKRKYSNLVNILYKTVYTQRQFRNEQNCIVLIATLLFITTRKILLRLISAFLFLLPNKNMWHWKFSNFQHSNFKYTGIKYRWYENLCIVNFTFLIKSLHTFVLFSTSTYYKPRHSAWAFFLICSYFLRNLSFGLPIKCVLTSFWAQLNSFINY